MPIQFVKNHTRLPSRFLLFLFITATMTSLWAADVEYQQKIGHWVHSDNLQPGMKILTADNRQLIVSKSWQQRQQRQTTYNLTVAKEHTYFIGQQQVWAHNMADCGEDDLI